MSKYPKNRTDLILSERIEEDCIKLRKIQARYRGLEKVSELNKCFKDIYRLLTEIIT